MAQYVAFDSRVEVNGETVLAIVDGMGVFADFAKKILAGCGISDPKPGKWYRQQSWLDAFRKIGEKVGSGTLTLIGRKIPENANFPPQIDTIEKALSSIDVAYHMNHRGGKIGSYEYQRVSGQSAVLVCANPYPCDFDRGIIDAMAQRFHPTAGTARVTHDDSKPCRKKGAEACTYHVAW